MDSGTKNGFVERVDAAMELWGRSTELMCAERALFALQGCFPGFDGEATLLKVVALHSMESNRSFPVARWAMHTHAVLENVDPRRVGPELVALLAAVPGTKISEQRRAVTVASRFAHYFVDVDRFPVLDSWAERELARWVPVQSEETSLYADFALRHAQLASDIGLTRPRRLWCYLWLAGQCRAWSRNPKTPIHRAARALFETQPAELLLLRSTEGGIALRTAA